MHLWRRIGVGGYRRRDLVGGNQRTNHQEHPWSNHV